MKKRGKVQWKEEKARTEKIQDKEKGRQQNKEKKMEREEGRN